MPTLGDRLNELISQDPERRTANELAVRCKVSKASVSDWRSGKSKTMKPENLVAVADFFKVNIRWLAVGEGPKRGDARQLHTEPQAVHPTVTRLSKAAANASRANTGAGSLIKDFTSILESLEKRPIEVGNATILDRNAFSRAILLIEESRHRRREPNWKAENIPLLYEVLIRRPEIPSERALELVVNKSKGLNK